MKILYISNNRFPTEKAHGLQIAKTCEAFLQEGSDLLFLGPKRKQTEHVHTDSPKKFYNLKVEIPQKKIRCIDLLLINWIPGIISYNIQSISFLIGLKLQKRSFKGNTIYTRSLIATLILGRKDKWCFEAHSFPASKLGQAFQKWKLKQSPYLVCISRGLAKKYAKLLNRDISKIHIAHDGVDIEQFSKLPKTTKSTKPIILYTGSPYPWKGVFTLAEACKDLDVECIFLGGRESESYYQNLILKAPHAQVIPFVAHEKVPEYLAKADILVLPNSAKNTISREDTSPLKLFEYMATGKKIVSSDVPALKEILSDEMAWFFRADDPISLKQTLEIALKSENTKGAKAAALSQKYSWETRVKNILTYLT